MLITTILHFSFLMLCFLQIFYFVGIVRAFLQHKDSFQLEKAQNFKLDFLIAVKNERINLESIVKALLKQKIFEQGKDVRIIIVNDHSDDGTSAVLDSLVRSFPKIILGLSLPTDLKGKKEAIKYGIRHACDNVLLMDADCRPAHDTWSLILAQALETSDLVIGYGPFYKENSFINRLIRFDCMWIAAQYFGWNKIRRPYMGVGRNMAVKTSLYKGILPKMKGRDLISGDDDLFVSAASGECEVDIVTNRKSFVYSAAESSYGSYIRQKKRQISTSVHYKLYHQIALAIDAAVKIIWPFLLIGIWLIMPVTSAMVYTAIFVGIQFLVHTSAARKLDEKDLYPIIPVLVLVYGLHLAILAVYSLTTRDKIWK